MVKGLEAWPFLLQYVAYCSLRAQIEVGNRYPIWDRMSLQQPPPPPISILHLIRVYPFMTLESDVPILIGNINIYKMPISCLHSNFVDIVQDERRWNIKPLPLSFCAFTYSHNLQTTFTSIIITTLKQAEQVLSCPF